jgi:hypothetical protein
VAALERQSLAERNRKGGSQMNKHVPISSFQVSDDDLETNQQVGAAYREFYSRRCAFGEAAKALKEATNSLHSLLDEPLRSAGLIPDGKEWTLKESDGYDGLIIQIWSEPRQRGRRKPEVPTKRFSFE